MCLEIIYSIYMRKKDLELNYLQWLVCLKIKPSQAIIERLIENWDWKKKEKRKSK